MNYTRIINTFNLNVQQVLALTSQQLQILDFISRFGSITPMDAFLELGITKLSTRISEMKKMGIQFEQNYEGRENMSGKKVHYMRYRKAA